MADIHSILSHSWVYRLFGRLIGAKRGRMLLLEGHIRPKEGMKILDIGCGPASILRLLPKVEYVGIDTNLDYIRNAQTSLSHRGTFIHRTIGRDDCKDLTGFDLVLAIGLLHHLDDQEALQLLAIAKGALKAGGRLVTMDGCYTDKQPWMARYLLKKDRGRFVRSEPAYLDLAHKVFPKVQSKLRQDLLNIPYTHLILECTT